MKQRHGHNSGFTLLEVIVAIGVVALLAAGLAVSLHVAFRAKRSVTDGAATARAMRLAVDSVGRDITAALPPTGVFASSFVGTENTGAGFETDSLTFSNTADPTRPVDGAGDIEEVTLTIIAESELNLPSTIVVAPNNSASSSSGLTSLTPNGLTGLGGLSGATTDQESKVNVQGPLLDPSASAISNQGLLVRRVRRHLLAQISETPVDQVLCRGATSFKLRYYDGSSWSTTWDSTTVNNVLPVAVEATIRIVTNEGADQQETKTVTRVFRLPCGVVSSDTTVNLSNTGAP